MALVYRKYTQLIVIYKMRIIELIIDEEDENSGVDAISLVEFLPLRKIGLVKQEQ